MRGMLGLGLAVAAGLALAPCLARATASIDVVRDFGAKGDGVTDDWEAIQRAVGMEASGYCAERPPTVVLIPPTAVNKYRISQAIRLCSNVTLKVASNATEIDFTGDAQGKDYTGAVFTARFPTFGALLGGTIGANLATPALAIAGPLKSGAGEVTLASAGDADQLRVGDIVDVETVSTFSPAGVQPTQLKMAIVSELPGAGVVKLDRRLDFASERVQLRRLSNLARTPGWPTLRNIGQDTHVPIFATHHCAVVGGRWVASGRKSKAQPFNAGGGMLECSFEPYEVVAGFGVGYVNLMQDCVQSVQRERIFRTPFEMAYHSSHSKTTIGVIDLSGDDPSQPNSGWAIAFDEGSHDNELTVRQIRDDNGGLNAEWKVVGRPEDGGGETLTATIEFPPSLAATPISGSYTTKPNDTLKDIAVGMGEALTANPQFRAAGYSAVASPPNAPHSVLVIGRNDKPFFVSGSRTKGLISYSPRHDLVKISNASDNVIAIGSVTGGFITGFIIEIDTGAPPGAPPPTHNNKVTVGETALPWQQGYVVINGAQADGNAIRFSRRPQGETQQKEFWIRPNTGAGNSIK